MNTTAERTYNLNLETGKIELHFSKSEYQAMPEEMKKLLKSNFLFSGRLAAWVSRCKEPNLYFAKQAAAKLGFNEGIKTGERLTFAEQVERQAEKAGARAERYEQYADNAETRARKLQAGFNECRKDWSWVTQPNINSSSGRAFTRQRERIIARYEKGFAEYKKSDYFKNRAAIAQSTAALEKFNDRVYLDNRIGECQKNIRAMERNLIKYEEILYALENSDSPKHTFYTTHGSYTVEKVTEWIENILERMEAEIDKQGYMENKLDEIGGSQFSRENIKPGYIVKIRHSQYEIIKANPKTVEARVISGGAAGMVLKYNYSEIKEVVKAVEAEEATPKADNIFKVGEILCAHRPADNSIYKAYQIVKVTATGVKIRRIAIENGKPIQGQFTSDQVTQKKVTKSKYSEFVGVYADDWQLHKWNN